jgi:hypothetical protein
VCLGDRHRCANAPNGGVETDDFDVMAGLSRQAVHVMQMRDRTAANWVRVRSGLHADSDGGYTQDARFGWADLADWQAMARTKQQRRVRNGTGATTVTPTGRGQQTSGLLLGRSGRGGSLASGAVYGGSVRGLRVALWSGAVVWLALLIVGFFAPGGWTWGMAGPIGHMENYMISLWFVGLVIAPALAAREPLTRTAAIQIYLFAVLAVCLSTFRGEQLKWIADGPPLAVAAACVAGVVATHPDRSTLLRF